MNRAATFDYPIRRALVVFVALAGLAPAGRAAAADEPPAGASAPGATVSDASPPASGDASQARPAPAAKDVAAAVNGAPISRAEVEGGVTRILGGRRLDEKSQVLIQAEVLSQLIDRLLVEQFVRRSGVTITDAQVEQAEKQTRLQLEAQTVTWDTFLVEQRQTEAEFRERLAWQLLWDRYLQRALNDQAYETFFDANRQEFDGTEVRVSHVLLRPVKGGGDTAAVQRLITEAQELRERIEKGQLTFEEAAARYSGGPSREHGGDLGFIPRQGLMVEAFAQAAFHLKPGEISQPVPTPFGVHLIKVTETKPGSKQWMDVREQLKPPIAQLVFASIARQERPLAKLVFSPGTPHFKPGTRELE